MAKIGLKERQKRLTSLVEDAEALKYDKKVVNDFKRQLAEVNTELKEISEKRKAFGRAKKIEELKTLKANLEDERSKIDPQKVEAIKILSEDIERMEKKIAKLEGKGKPRAKKKRESKRKQTGSLKNSVAVLEEKK